MFSDKRWRIPLQKSKQETIVPLTCKEVKAACADFTYGSYSFACLALPHMQKYKKTTLLLIEQIISYLNKKFIMYFKSPPKVDFLSFSSGGITLTIERDYEHFKGGIYGLKTKIALNISTTSWSMIESRDEEEELFYEDNDQFSGGD